MNMNFRAGIEAYCLPGPVAFFFLHVGQGGRFRTGTGYGPTFIL